MREYSINTGIYYGGVLTFWAPGHTQSDKDTFIIICFNDKYLPVPASNKYNYDISLF